MSPITPIYLPATGLIRDEPVKQNFEYIEANWGTLAGRLAPANASVNYTAKPWDFVIANQAGLTITLPAHPADGDQVGVNGYQTLTATPTRVNAAPGQNIWRNGVSSTSTTVGVETLVLSYESKFNDWRVVSDTISTKPWAMLTNNATFTTNGAWVNATWSSVSAGGGMAGPGINSTGITVLAQGIYRVSGNMRVDSVVAGQYSQMQIIRNDHTGTLLATVGISIATGNGGFQEHVVNVLTPMNPQDYLTMQCFSSSLGTWQAVAGGWCQMACELISYGLI